MPRICTGQEQSVRKKDVPKSVLDAFAKAYPGATIKAYAREKDREGVTYEIESVEGLLRRDVSYAADGSVVSVEESVSVAEIPDAVKSAMAREHPTSKIVSCERISRQGALTFEIVGKIGKSRHEYMFNLDGTKGK